MTEVHAGATEDAQIVVDIDYLKRGGSERDDAFRTWRKEIKQSEIPAYQRVVTAMGASLHVIAPEGQVFLPRLEYSNKKNKIVEAGNVGIDIVFPEGPYADHLDDFWKQLDENNHSESVNPSDEL